MREFLPNVNFANEPRTRRRKSRDCCNRRWPAASRFVVTQLMGSVVTELVSPGRTNAIRTRLQPNRDASFGKVACGFGDRGLAIMKKAGGERGTGFTDGARLKEMLRTAGTAAGDD